MDGIYFEFFFDPLIGFTEVIVRRIRRRLQGTAETTPKMEVLHGPGCILVDLLIKGRMCLLLSEATVLSSHTREQYLVMPFLEINGPQSAWNRLAWYTLKPSGTSFWQDHLTKPLFTYWVMNSFHRSHSSILVVALLLWGDDRRAHTHPSEPSGVELCVRISCESPAREGATCCWKWL